MRRVCLLLALGACGRLGFDGRDASPDTAIAPVTCGTSVLLDDPFTDAMPAPLFTSFTSNGMSITEAGGSVSFVFAPNVGEGRYSGYETASFLPSQEMCATVEVTEIPTSEGLAYFNILGGTQKIEFIVYRGNLEVRTTEGTMIGPVAIFAFDPVAHRFLRLRQQGGVTYWDVSADGAEFFVLAQRTFFTAPTARPAIGAGGVMTTTDGGRFTVEQMRITQP